MSGHGHTDHGGNKGVALLISVLALVLALSETLGKSAQTTALGYNIEASNLWAFFQVSICFFAFSLSERTSICSAAARSVVWRMVLAWKKAHRFEASML